MTLPIERASAEFNLLCATQSAGAQTMQFEGASVG
jgi:hypothetical protein